MTLLKSSGELRVMLAVVNPVERERIEQAITDGRETGGGADPLTVVDEDEGGADVLVVEVGGSSQLELFRGCQGRFPSTPVVVVCTAAERGLAEVAIQHGADDAIGFDEVSGPVIERVLRFSLERHRLIRQLVAAREREAQLATHDSVTGLANRSLLFTCVAPAMSFAERKHTGIALVCIGLRDLSGINERFGFQAGDRILGSVAERLQDTIRTSDMVARLGGSEFVVLLRDIGAAADADRAVQGIFTELARPLYVAGHKITVEISAGVALFPPDGRDAETLMMTAHRTMLEAKAGENHYEFTATGQAGGAAHAQ